MLALAFPREEVAGWLHGGGGGVVSPGGRRRTVAGAAEAAGAGSSATGSGIAGAGVSSSAGDASAAAAAAAVAVVASVSGIASASIGLFIALRLLLATGCNSWTSPKNDAPGNWGSSVEALGSEVSGIGYTDCDYVISGSASNDVVPSTCSQSISVILEASISGAVSISSKPKPS